MAKITLDLSGSLGLTPKYYGDVNRAVPDANLSYNGKDGELADGNFNPLRRFGFISPANQASAQVSFTGTMTTLDEATRCAVYDQVSDQSILATKSHLTFATGGKAVSFASTAHSWGTISDMQYYILNSVRKLFVLQQNSIGIVDTSTMVYDINWSVQTFINAVIIQQTSLTSSSILVNSTSGLPTTGSFYATNTSGVSVQIEYTGVSGGNTFTGCTGGAGTAVSGTTILYIGAVQAPSNRGTTNLQLNVNWDYNRFVLADNGFLYVLNKDQVHKIDGTPSGGPTGTITFTVLQTQTNFIFYDGVDYRGNMIMAMNQLNATNDMRNSASANVTPVLCGVYVWDRLSTISRMKDFIPLYGMKEIRRIFVSHRGDVLVIAVGSNNTTNLFQYTGTGFKFLKSLGVSAYPLQWGSLTVGTSCTYWLGFDGVLYGWGSPDLSQPDSLFQLIDLNTTVTTNHPASTGLYRTGALLLTTASYTVSANYAPELENLYLSYAYNVLSPLFETVKYIINGVDIQDGVTPVANVGSVYSLVKRLPVFSTLNYVRVYNLPTPSTGASTIATVRVYRNMSSTELLNSPVLQKEAALGYKYIAVDVPDTYAVQLRIDFGTSAQLGMDDFSPLYAEIDYTDMSVSPDGSSDKQR